MEDILLKGKMVDEETRCVHYHSQVDVIAIKFRCCGVYYPCYSCHQEEVDHEAINWTKEEYQEKAILCGVCKNEMTITEYMESESTCPHCTANFNPLCKNHFHLYFDEEEIK